MAFFDSEKYQKKTDAHAVQIHFVPLLAQNEDQGRVNFGFDRAIHEMASLKPVPPVGVTFLPSLLQPKSSGWIELTSNNPNDHPIIEPNYLSHEDDVEVLSEAWKFCDRLANTASMKKALKGPLEDDSVTNRYPYGSDEYIKYKIKRDVVTVSRNFHEQQPA